MASRDVIHEAVLQLRADTTQLRSDLAAGRGMFEGSLKGMQSLARSLVPVLSIGGLAAFGKSVIDLAGQLQDLHEQTGISAQRLSGIKSVLEENGSSVETFAKGVFNLQKNLGNVDSDSDAAAQAIKHLGLSLNDLRNSSPDDFIKKVIDALGNIKNPVERNTLLFNLLGKSAKELGPAFQSLVGRLDELTAKGMSPEAIAKLDAFGDSWTRLGNRLQILASGPLADFVDKFDRLFGGNTQSKVLGSQINTLDGQIAGLNQRMEKLQDSADGAIQKMFGQLKAQRDALVATRDALKGTLAEITPPQKTPPPGVPLPSKAGIEADKSIQQFSDSLEKQRDALVAQRLELTQGKDAALEFALTMQIGAKMEDLFAQKVPTEKVRKFAFDMQALIPEIVKEADALERGKLEQEAFFASLGSGDETLNRSAQEWRELGKAVEELVGAPNETLKKQLADIAIQAEILGESFDAAGARINALRTNIEGLRKLGFSADSPEIAGKVSQLGNEQSNKNLKDFQREMDLINSQAGVFGASFDSIGAKISTVTSEITRLLQQGLQPASADIQQLKTQLDGLKNLQAVESSFDSLLNGITQSLAGARMGTQSFAEALKNTLANALSSLSENMLKAGLEPLKKQLSGFLQSSFPSFFGGLAGAGKDIALSANTAALNALTVALGGAGVSGALGGGIPAGLEGPLMENGGFFSGGGGGFDLSKIFSGITEKLSSMMSGLMDGLKSALSGLGDMFSSMFSSIGSFIMGLFDTGGFVGMGGLPSFAAGGAVPILAHQGEFVMRSAAVQSIGRGAMSDVNRTGKFPDGGGQAGGPIHLHITHDYTNAVAPSDLKTKRKEVETYIIENWRKGGTVRTMIMGDKGHR